MHQLKLPDYAHKIDGDRIFCLIRKKWILLTPEEWVRQHFIHLLVTHLGYPKGLFKLEHTMKYFKNQKRSDIMVLDKEGDVFMLVECKSADVVLDNKVMNQLSTYNKVLDSKYLAITNGLSHYIWERIEDGFEQIKEFPDYKL